MKILLIIIFTILIFLCAYLPNKRKHKWVAVCIGLAAAIPFAATFIVDSVGHKHEKSYEERDNIIDATCFDGGSYESVSYCECGEELSREVFITAPLGHNYIATITDPSCGENGFTTHTCSRCKNSYVDDYTDALGHNYIATITEPFCEENGFTTYTCSGCKDSYIDNYVDALGHDFVEEICSRCGTVSSEYEPLIISRANELVDIGKYDEASNVVSEALDRVSSDSLQQLLSSIQGMQEKDSKYTAKNVDFITYSGSINSSDQTDVYSLEAPTTGYYRFDLSDMVSGFSVRLQVHDSAGSKVGGDSGIGNENGITCELAQGNTYTVKVMSYSNTGSYALTIGQQKEMFDISTKELVYDSIEYKNQQNEYTFIPLIDGTYRFDFTNLINGFSLRVHVYDSLGYKVGGDSGLGNGSGVTVELTANEIYTIKVIQYSSVGAYTMAIGKQQNIQNITGSDSVSGDITFKSQKNIYEYIPSSTGEYVFSLNNMVSGFSVRLQIYDSLGYKVGGDSGMRNDSKVTVNLTAGETYTIYLMQYGDTGSYDINISYKAK